METILRKVVLSLSLELTSLAGCGMGLKINRSRRDVVYEKMGYGTKLFGGTGMWDVLKLTAGCRIKHVKHNR